MVGIGDGKSRDKVALPREKQARDVGVRGREGAAEVLKWYRPLD